MSLLARITKQLRGIHKNVDQLHSLFEAVVYYHSNKMSVREANASLKACYPFDAEFTASAFRLWTCSRYTMVNLKYFVKYLALHPKMRRTRVLEFAAAYGVDKKDALMITCLIDLKRIDTVDEEMITVQAMKRDLDFLNSMVPDLRVALERQVGKHCQWLRRCANLQIKEMASDIMGDVIPVYYAALPSTKTDDHMRNYMFSAVSSRVKNYLNMMSASKRKRSVQIEHRDGSVDYEYVEVAESTLQKNATSHESFLEEFLAVDESGDDTNLQFELDRSIKSMLTRAPSKCKPLYRLILGRGDKRFQDFLSTRKCLKRNMTATDWILSVPFPVFVSMYSAFANMSEDGVQDSIELLRDGVFNGS